MTLEAEEAWLAVISSGESNVAFTIYERATWRPIGLCGLHDLDLRHPDGRVRVDDRREGVLGIGATAPKSIA